MTVVNHAPRRSLGLAKVLARVIRLWHPRRKLYVTTVRRSAPAGTRGEQGWGSRAATRQGARLSQSLHVLGWQDATLPASGETPTKDVRGT